jgi:bifunctional UDP-N-acetylglucosamine pyrophosphorylase/glucosamine-1-phosphate N-acetyltransferase
MDGVRPKALVPLGGKPMLLRVLEAVRDAGIDEICVVVGHEADKVVQALPDGCRWVEQPAQGGTAHALACCEPHLSRRFGTLVVLYCDNPFITGPQVKSLIRNHLRTGAAATVLTVELPSPGRFGRIVRDDEGNLLAIVEASEASEEQLDINEVNTGVYCFQSPLVFSVLPHIVPKGRKEERYLTDAVELLIRDSHKVVAVKTRIKSTAIGVNTREELEAAERELERQEKRRKLTR